MSEKPHSADYFGEPRDFWWNRDFLELMGVRWDLSKVRQALDVGCGIGHWGRCLAPLLPAGCVLTGVDREPRWVEEARKRSAGIAPIEARFQQGEAERLPFPEHSFDLVTCQTLLIHVKDPLAVIREMLRVLVPGGLLVIVEPNNVAATISSIDPQVSVSDEIGLLEFRLICERGKMNLGEGFNSAGPWVAGWLSELEVEHIQSYLADKTTILTPPYSSARERAIVREAEEMSQRDFWIWNREDTRRYFLAGGGVQDTFDARWNRALAQGQTELSKIRNGTLRHNSAGCIYLVSGRKRMPRTPLPNLGECPSSNHDQQPGAAHS